VFRGGSRSTTEFGSAAEIAAAVQIAGGQTAVTGSRDGTVRQWSLERTAKQLLQGGRNAIDGATQGPALRDIVISADGQQALVAYYNEQDSKLWRRNGSPQMIDIKAQTMSPDGRFLIRQKILSDTDGPAAQEHEIVRLADEKIVHTIDGEHGLVAFASSDAVLLAGANGELSIWKFGASNPEWTTGIQVQRGYGGAYAISPDGSRVLAEFDGKIQIWKVGQAQPEASLTIDSEISEARFLPDNTRFALGFNSGAIELWSVGSDRPLESFDGHSSRVQHIAFSATGNLMATASVDGATLWRIGNRASGAGRRRYAGADGVRTAGAAECRRLRAAGRAEHADPTWTSQQPLRGDGDHAAKARPRDGEANNACFYRNRRGALVIAEAGAFEL
jgi:WD40 repeat protein